MVETVDDVKREPADSKQSHNNGQRLGSVNLPLQRGARRLGWEGHLPWRGSLSNLETHQPELAPGRHEDVCVDEEHDQQGQQHTAEEVKVDHVVHDHHAFEQALGQTVGTDVVAGGGSGVPTCQNNRKSRSHGFNKKTETMKRNSAGHLSGMNSFSIQTDPCKAE